MFLFFGGLNRNKCSEIYQSHKPKYAQLSHLSSIVFIKAVNDVRHRIDCLTQTCDTTGVYSAIDLCQNKNIIQAEAIMEKTLKALTLILIALVPMGCEGPAGPPGDDGIAEIYSDTIVLDADLDFGVVDEYLSVASFGWGPLDEETVDYGVVLAYLRFSGTTAWHALPLVTPFDGDVVVLRYSFDIDNFDLIIEGEVAGNNEINEDLFHGDVLRIVAIPPAYVSRAKGLDYSNYENVVAHYGLTF